MPISSLQPIISQIKQWKSAGFVRTQSSTKLRLLFPSLSVSDANKFIDAVYKRSNPMRDDTQQTFMMIMQAEQWAKQGLSYDEIYAKLKTMGASASEAHVVAKSVASKKNPLSRGCSRKSIGKNISSLISGKGHTRPRSQKQAVAIALDYARAAGCDIPRKNPPQNLLEWFKNIYQYGQIAAVQVMDEVSESEFYTTEEANRIFKRSMRDAENASNIIFNKIEKGLFLEGFIHKLINL